MNEAVAFDTHRFVKHLTATGFTEQQAEEQVAFLNGNLATKANLAELEAALKVDIAEVKSEIIKWTIGIALGVAAVQTTLTVGLVVGLLS